ncbi:reverse transcriptase-like protein [Staphylococcus gallinarum]|uniref:Reverse transcriptase-like protein n=1 Tax=Staphylococcus gallinarum TaxID=1293 RepID=A0A3A0W2X4_STAGA|nr:ribonuclease HI family protein [Staphylococcus gallinarum]RIP34325.1 reverse transcriptase-like protein [Staphylococcus gallinarum]
MAKIFFDAATAGNPGQSVAAVVIITEEQRYHYTIDLGIMDNHTAEWAGLVLALEKAYSLDIKTALVYTDSKLIEDTLHKGQVKNEKFKPYLNQVHKMEHNFDLFFVRWIPRAQNKEANHHAQNALYQLTKGNKK